ncbi:MAG TPA: carboxypeptidase-like regulatory domain-containing protein [Acidobacteriaceae bacterium]
MKSTMLRGCLAVSTILLLVTLRAASGQTPGTGAISGIVYDPANRVVAHAEVIAIEESTQVTRRVATTSEGVFRVPLLSPGAYTVTVTATGFATSTAHGVQVSVSQTTALNLKLVVAGTSSSVQVSAGSQMADLDSSTIGGLVDQTAIEELPLANRNYTQILALAPGVIVDLPVPTQLGRGSQNVASDGATPTANNIQFNGIDANNLTQNSAANAESSQVGVAVPAPDTIQEFRVQTANFDGAYGRGSGANVDAISKGGTNHFHGSVWEFVRNNIFDANDFFSKLNQQPRAELKHNQFGASLGGPLRRDKTFFLGLYQITIS